MTGKRVRLSYHDQNESFGRALPAGGVDGTILRQLALDGWGDDWYLLALDQPFEYEGVKHNRVLIRSRWEKHGIGDREPTSVFVLLIPHPSALDEAAPSPGAFDHVAWGMAHTLPVA